MENPGPGNYNPTDGKFARDAAYSMAGRKSASYADEVPGPGMYEYEKPRNKTGAVFGSGKRDHRAGE